MGHERFKFVKYDVTEYLHVEGRLDNILHFASLASQRDYLDYPIQTLKVGSLGTHKTLGLAKEKKARFLGKESVSGIACKKYELAEDGTRTIYWVSTDLNFPLKIDGPDATMEYKNIDQGPLADTLFDPPPDYDRITMDDPTPEDRELPPPAPLKLQK